MRIKFQTQHRKHILTLNKSLISVHRNISCQRRNFSLIYIRISRWSQIVLSAALSSIYSIKFAVRAIFHTPGSTNHYLKSYLFTLSNGVHPLIRLFRSFWIASADATSFPLSLVSPSTREVYPR